MKNTVRNLNFTPALNSQIEVIQLHKLVSGNKKILTAPHRTGFYHIFLFGNCQPVHQVDFNPVKIRPNSLLFVGKGRVHQFDHTLRYDGLLLVFTDQFFCLTEHDTTFLNSSILFNDLHDNCQVNTSGARLRKLRQIATAIQQEFKDFNPSVSPIIQKNLLHNFLLITETEKQTHQGKSTTRNSDFGYCQHFKTLLEKHVKESKSVAFYADKLGISERRLGQATQALLGKLPKVLINDRLLLEAKRLLVHGQLSVKEIAYALGFAEPTNFVKHFKKHTLHTPMEFKEKNLPANLK